jgi:membrane dipeptidase
MLAGEAGPRGSTAAAKTAEDATAALALLRRSISVDVHTHGGKTGISSKAPPSDDLSEHMREGALAVACLAEVRCRRYAARPRANFTATISNVWPGWTSW